MAQEPISQKPLLRALTGETLERPPWWLMRQAGRYLPEYRKLRAEAGDFVTLCLTPALAAEVTLQPVRRFGMDAAILFSDILLVPHALGQGVAFSGEGPVLEPIADAAGLARLSRAGMIGRLEPVFEAIRRVRTGLDDRTALIGFAGAPWTVACYMVEGGGSRDFRQVKLWAYRDARGFSALIDLLVDMTIELLAAEIAAGVDAVQLFDSWAGILPEDAFERWVVAPTQRVVAGLRRRCPGTPIIGFPRGAGLYYQRYQAVSGVDAVGLDSMVPAGFARDRMQPLGTVQGNLDPVLLVAGGAALREAVGLLRRTLGHGPYIFNLGHGVLPQTPPEHVALLAQLLAETGKQSPEDAR